MSILGGSAEKGARYLGLLDQALCNGAWAEIPELTRKVDKHAPDRNCLTLAARSQARIFAASHRPSSAASTISTSLHSLAELINPLREIIRSRGQSHPHDVYIARLCVAEIHWTLEDPLDVLETLDAARKPPDTAKGPQGVLGWLEICAVKAVLLRATSLESSGREHEARECYRAAVLQTPGYRSPGLREWTERLLARACICAAARIPSTSLQDFNEAYTALKMWGDFWQRVQPATGDWTGSSRLDPSRRQVWKAYYDLFSALLQRGLVYNVQPNAEFSLVSGDEIPEHQLTATRQRQRAEFKQVEATYETFLLAETKFPKSTQTNTEAEEWANKVMANWRVFSGPGWTDSDVGAGGKRSVSRGVLDILYRAATKSFHSTPILRHLFTVHAALGEFDLAMHAFDSYVEIVDKGKARAEKTGKHENGLDDDDTALLTATQAIDLLCRYGDRQQAEKASQVSATIQKWLQQQRPLSAGDVKAKGDAIDGDSEPTKRPTAPVLRTKTVSAAHRAIGISQALWAQLTYDSDSRWALLADAKSKLQRALQLDARSIETAHVLALVLTEMRDVSGAMDLIRATITPQEQLNGETDDTSLDRQRQLIPFWHLLALCLTAEDQFEAAVDVCEAAYRQLGNSDVLFGTGSSPADPEIADDDKTGMRGVVDQMESFEKERMIQLKMTQMTLCELIKGPEYASNLTDELSSLYSKLFGNPERVVADLRSRPPATATSSPHSKVGGKLRSIVGSVRPRSGRPGRIPEKEIPHQRQISSDANAALSAQAATNGLNTESSIAITVTDEDGGASGNPPHGRLSHRQFHQSLRHRSSTLRSRSPATGNSEHTDPASESPNPAPADAAATETARPDQRLGEVAHNAPHHKWPSPPGHGEQPPTQDVRLPAPHPASASNGPERQGIPMHEQRHKISVLIQAWLFSASLYIRAESYDDAENLIRVTEDLVRSLELELALSEDGMNAERLSQKGWGSGKSIDGLWADFWSMKAELALARSRGHEAMEAFEQSLFHEPDHVAGVVGLSTLLMDIYEEKMAAEETAASRPSAMPSSTAASLISEARSSLTRPNTASSVPFRRLSDSMTGLTAFDPKAREADPTPAELNRLAARDRAYMLLTTVTRQGSGWDSSEAWFALARAHELSRDISKAKQALWWVVELENKRPIRPWREVSSGGYTLS